MDIDKNMNMSAATELRCRAEEQLKAKASEAGFPRTVDEAQQLLHELQVHLPPSEGGMETILLAEDDECVRILTAQILSGFGYRVITAEDGADAVRKFLAHQDAIRLLLFDVIMPHWNGTEAYDEINQVCPGVRALFMSGYPPDFLGDKVLKTGMEIIMKPFSPLDLKIKVRETLDKRNQ